MIDLHIDPATFWERVDSFYEAWNGIADAAVVESLCALASEPLCLSVYLSAPCKTWCATRRLRPGPPRLRIDVPGQRWPMGMPHLTPYWQSVVTEHNLIVTNGVRVMQACWDAGGAAAAECPVDRSPSRALHPRHVLPDCEGHVSQFTHPAFQHFMTVTGAHVFWGDQCALEWRPFPSAPLPPQKTTQWMLTETLREGGEQMAKVLRCPDHHDHGGNNSLVGGATTGRFRTAGSEQYCPPLCRMLFDLLFSHHKSTMSAGDDDDGGLPDDDYEPTQGRPQTPPPGQAIPPTPPPPLHNTRLATRRGLAPTTTLGAPSAPATTLGAPSPCSSPDRTPRPSTPPSAPVKPPGNPAPSNPKKPGNKKSPASAMQGERHHDICLYVDDGFASADVDCPAADDDMQILHDRFKLTSQDDVDLFVGLNVSDNPDGSVELSSEAYINLFMDVRPLHLDAHAQLYLDRLWELYDYFP